MEKLNIPESAAFVIKALEHEGFEAYVVGGCVRDSLIGRVPNDWDVCTSARPAQVLKIFAENHPSDIGIKQGTVAVRVEKDTIEITTYRVESQYMDKRHPDDVQFVNSLREDLSRRDFRINAIAYHPETGLMDYFGGAEDLKKRIIRCVGDPDIRFQEDALRILRAMRFASVLDFTIDKTTRASLHRNREGLKVIPAERVSEEFRKMLTGPGAETILLEYFDILGVIIPEFRGLEGFGPAVANLPDTVWNSTIRMVCGAPLDDFGMRLALLFRDAAKTDDEKTGVERFFGQARQSAMIATTIMRRMKFDHATVSDVQFLILYQNTQISEDQREIKRWLQKSGEAGARRILEMKRIIAKASGNDSAETTVLIKIQAAMETILAEKQCYSLEQMAVTGQDLLAAGIPQGVWLGIVLRKLLDQVIDGQLENTREALMKGAEDLYREIQNEQQRTAGSGKPGKSEIMRLLEVKKSSLLQEAFGRGHSKPHLEPAPEKPKEKPALTREDLKIGTEELAAIGVPKGLWAGIILRKLTNQVLDGVTENEPEPLLKAARVLYEKMCQVP